MISYPVSKQFLAFLFMGGMAALVNFTSRMVYNHWFSFSTSVILAYITGMTVGFILMKCFVFRGSRKHFTHSALFYILINLFAAFQTWLISMLLAYYLLPHLGVETFTKEIAHAVGIAIPAFTSYIGHKRWTFPE